MIAILYHSEWQTPSDGSAGVRFPDNYTNVIEMSLSDALSDQDACERIFVGTQNVFGPWRPKSPCHSTSVGDIICITRAKVYPKGQYYRIALTGFRHVGTISSAHALPPFVSWDTNDDAHIPPVEPPRAVGTPDAAPAAPKAVRAAKAAQKAVLTARRVMQIARKVYRTTGRTPKIALNLVRNYDNAGCRQWLLLDGDPTDEGSSVIVRGDNLRTLVFRLQTLSTNQ